MAALRPIFSRLRRAPGFTAVALITLAIGIGATTAVFSVVQGILLQPLPYPHPSQLVSITQTTPGLSVPYMPLGPSDYFVFQQRNHVFQSLGLYNSDTVSVTGRGQPEEVRVLDVTAGTLQALEVQPHLGRLFNAKDDKASSRRTAVLTYSYWRRRFGGRATVIGQSIIASGQPREIIGVLPAGFRFLDHHGLSLLLPLRFDRSKVTLGNFGFQCLARLKPGMTLADARADEGRMLPIVLRAFPAPPAFGLSLFTHAHLGPRVQPLRDAVVGDVSSVLWIVLGGIFLVLLIACANVANLMLVRAESRQQELAIRAALGCGRRRLAGELLGDSLALGLIGGAIGLGLAYAALQFLHWLAPSGLPRLDDIGLHPWVLAFCFAAAVVAGLLAGILPAVRYSRVAGAVREGGRSQSAGRQRQRARNVLVLAQVALACVLLICAGLMIRTFAALRNANPGYRSPATLQAFAVYIPASGVNQAAAVVRDEAEMLRKLAALPGVRQAAIARSVPMSGRESINLLFIAGRHYARGQMPPSLPFNVVSPGFFPTLGIPLIAGREFTWTDNFDLRPVAVVSANFAEKNFGSSAAALGQRIRIAKTEPWRRIIGVVGNVHANGLNHAAPQIAYWPLLMANFFGEKLYAQRYVTFVLRSPQAGSASLVREARRAIHGVDPNLPLMMIHTLGYYYQQSLSQTSFTLVMLGIAGAMALLLGAVGLYGVLAYAVSQRRREIGIRLALGQDPRAVEAMILRQGLTLAALGVGAGVVLALGAARLLASLLFGVRATDAPTYIAIIIVLGCTAALASWLPARRAARVDPVEALRAE